MSSVQTTYSFKDLAGVLANPQLGSPVQLAGGNIGIGQITIRMTTQRTEHNVAADGAVMPSYVAGKNAELVIEVQQTSDLHHILLGLFNTLETLSESGDLAAWADTTITFRTLLDGALHIFRGVSFQKIGDKAYQQHGQNVTWTLMAAEAINQ